MSPASCPCGRNDAKGRPVPLQGCCGPWLAGAAAPDAESLMRSRYTAYVLADEPYLLGTWHAGTRPPHATVEAGTRWLGLEVRNAREIDADHAEVEFVARYRVQGKGARIHERSRFLREGGRWFYVDGDPL